MPFDLEDNAFLLAGPVKMHPRVLRAMSRPAISHRSPEFKKMHEKLDADLAWAFQTQGPVVTIAGSGTAGMEAAVASTLRKGEKAVVLVNGKFGERMAELAKMYSTATVLESPWGRPHDPAVVERALEGAKALLLVHNETSTGMTNPLPELARLARSKGALVIADVITSLGGLNVPVDAWGLDVAIAGSQKCLGAPPGLAYVSVSERARAAMAGAPGMYLNLDYILREKAKEGEHPFTPATHTILGALEGLALLREEGLDKRFARVARIADAVRRSIEDLGLTLVPDARHASNTVTAAHYPAGVDDKAFRNGLKDQGVVIAGGQGPLKGKIFRVGHMGTVGAREVAAGMLCIEAGLAGAGAAVKRGSVAAAFLPVLGG